MTFKSVTIISDSNQETAEPQHGHQVSPKKGRSTQLTVQTGLVAAAVQLLLAVGAGVAGRAAASVASSHGFHTGATIETRAVGAGHGNDLAVLPVKTLRAGARVVVLQVLVRG